MPWQQGLFDVAYEYDPETGLFRYDEVDVTVPRQSGKTTSTLAKKVHRLTVMARTLGPQRSTYTAQTRLKARQKLEKDFAEKLRSARAFREVPHAKARPQKATEWRLSLNNGSESIQFGSGSFLQIDAPSRTGGHGDTLDDGTIDEAFSQDDDTVEAGMRPSMATRKNAQLWVISTAGDGRSLYLWRKVLAGRAAHEAGQHGRTCYVEYSAPEDADPGNLGVWHGCMPALGITISEDFIRGEWERALRKGPEGIDMFRRAYLNQWPVIPQLPEELSAQALPLEVWEQLVDQSAERGATPTFGVAMAQDRSWAAIATAWHRPDGLIQTLLLDYHTGTTWLPERVEELRSRWGGTVTTDTASRGVVAGAQEPSQQVQAQAHNRLADLIGSRGVRHGGEPALMVALRAARWRAMGDTRVLDRKSSTDITPLIATALAVHATSTASTGGWMLSL
jgi:phage terminase large subunit-like protein